MASERLFSGWRIGHPRGVASDGEAYEELNPEPGKTLFETIEQSDLEDFRTYVVHRSEFSFVLLNIFPYTSGHCMVLPKRAVVSMESLDEEEFSDLWRLVRQTAVVLKRGFRPDGLNIGINEGRSGGGSQPDHLHVHVVPRWFGDTSFMSATAETRILPITLSATWKRLRDTWDE